MTDRPRGACWVCGSPRTRERKRRNLVRALSPEDFRITDARYGVTLGLRECKDCGFLFADDAELPRIESLYAALDDPEYEAGAGTRARQMRWLIERCLEQKPNAVTLLDVGAANGLLVEEAARYGLDAIGVEPSAALAEAATERGVPVLTGTLPHPGLAGKRFDLVLLVDVVEHVTDPVGLCREAARHLAPGGLVVVVTPNVRSVAARLLRDAWWHFRVAHVGYFSRRSFDRAAARAGLTVVGHRPALWFFPVGYLADRVARYLPTGGAARALERTSRTRVGRRVRGAVVPLNLFDSSVYFLTE